MLAAIKANPPTTAAAIVFDPFRRNMVLSTPCRGRILPCAGRDLENLARNRGASPSIQRATVKNPSGGRGHFAVKKAQQIRSRGRAGLRQNRGGGVQLTFAHSRGYSHHFVAI